MLYQDQLKEFRGGKVTNLHCASQPCRVTEPVSSESVVSGNLWDAQGLPGDVPKTSSSSEGLSAPS